MHISPRATSSTRFNAIARLNDELVKFKNRVRQNYRNSTRSLNREAYKNADFSLLITAPVIE